MRDQLEDAEKHRDDGYGRAQAFIKPELPKRFYQEAGVVPVEGGFAVTLDNRPTRTPGKKVPVVVAEEAIARAMADEWAAQGTHIDAETMPTVRLVNSALESGDETVPAFRAEVLNFAGNDLLLYRADAPQELVAEQEAVWDAALVLLARHFGIGFQPTIGIIHQKQPSATLARLEDSLADAGLLEATALVSITGLTGSGLLAIALRHGLIDPEAAWTAAHVDEDYQARLWGVDEEAKKRRDKRKTEFDAAVSVLRAVRRE